jgi:AbiV family abortive infection protein
MLTPTAARALWLALVENAARIVVDADALYPSPRAQSLIVLAQEEVGKAAWVYKAFWNAWNEGDERQLEVPELRKGAVNHLAKLIEAADRGTVSVKLPGEPSPIEVELVKAHAPEFLASYFKKLAQEDNTAKQRGFYVDLQSDGSFTVPQAIERPLLRAQIWETADMINWFLTEDHFLASMGGRWPTSSTEELEALLAPVLARSPDD